MDGGYALSREIFQQNYFRPVAASPAIQSCISTFKKRQFRAMLITGRPALEGATIPQHPP